MIFSEKFVCLVRWQALADAMTGISTNAKQAELSGFCDCVGHFANAVCGIIENSAQVCDCNIGFNSVMYQPVTI